MEFPDGSELVVTLEYKNLKNQCYHYRRLSHEKKDCPRLSTSKNTLRNGTSPPPRGQNQSQPNPSYNYRDARRGLDDNQSRLSTYRTSQEGHYQNKRKHEDGNSRNYSDHAERNYEQRLPNNRRSPIGSYGSYRGEPIRGSSRQPISNSRPIYQWREKDTTNCHK